MAANVLKEAQASGLPTLAPDSGGIGELIKDGETGFVYQPTVEDFQNKVFHECVRSCVVCVRMCAFARVHVRVVCICVHVCVCMPMCVATRNISTRWCLSHLSTCGPVCIQTHAACCLVWYFISSVLRPYVRVCSAICASVAELTCVGTPRETHVMRRWQGPLTTPNPSTKKKPTSGSCLFQELLSRRGVCYGQHAVMHVSDGLRISW